MHFRPGPAEQSANRRCAVLVGGNVVKLPDCAGTWPVTVDGNRVSIASVRSTGLTMALERFRSFFGNAGPRWFTRVGYAESGPFATEAILTALRSGTILGDVAVRQDGSEQWCNLRDHPTFASPSEGWVARSGRLAANDFQSVPGWHCKTLQGEANELALRFEPVMAVPASITLFAYRGDVTGPIASGHESLQALDAFLSAILSFDELEGPGRPYRELVIQRIDRLALGVTSGVPWAWRTLCRVNGGQAPSDSVHYEWLVLTAARDHFIKVLVSVAPEERAWNAVLDFLAYLGSVLSPRDGLSDTIAQEPSPAEQEQMAVVRAILEDESENPGNQIYLSFVLDQADRLASMPHADVNDATHVAMRLAQFAQFLARRGVREAEGACFCSVVLFRRIVERTRSAHALRNLQQALSLLHEFAVARDNAPHIESIREELGMIEHLLSQPSH